MTSAEELLISDADKGRVMEMALSARKLSASEAAQVGLVTQVCQTQDNLRSQTLALAAAIAKKSPVAATGIKRVMIHARYCLHRLEQASAVSIVLKQHAI